MNPLHEANRKMWNAGTSRWKAMHDRRGTWKHCHQDPSLVFNTRELEYLTDIAGRDVCVLGSGDNLAVFALSGLGAKVTSVDISQEQLKVAENRAVELGLPVVFIPSDVSDLSQLENESFDLIYTGGHVAVWVSDLHQYYAEAIRILRSGGLFIVNEYHPFRRIWKDSPDSLELEFGYFDRGPHQYNQTDDILSSETGSFVSYEFQWTISDYVKTVMDLGCELIKVDEYGDEPEGWEGAPLQGLPLSLLIVAKKQKV